MAYTFDYVNQQIDVASLQTVVDCQDLYNNICQQQASVQGICFETIATASGKQALSSGVSVGITIDLLYSWQLNFPVGNYVASVLNGNLVANNTNGAVAYTPGVQVKLIQSAASTIITESGGSSGGTATVDAASLFATLNTPGTYPVGSIGYQILKSASLAGITLNK